MTGLRVSSLSYAYGQKTALDDVSFDVEQGQFCALLGPNGAGKSTLFSLLTRLFVSPSGAIEISGFDLAQNPRKALAQLGVVFQQSTLDMDLSVWQNLKYFAALHGFSHAEASKRIDGALDRLDMRERAKEKVRVLNGGHRRRTEIARALIHAPSVLLLDEPTVGLDAAARISITEHVHRLAIEDGTTVLWATHLTDEVTPTDQLVILHRARILANDMCKNIAAQDTLSSTFLSMTAETA